MKKDRELENRTKELAKLDVEIRELQLKLGSMHRTPKYAQEFSSASIERWERELAKLEERKNNIVQEMAELRGDPERLKEIVARSTVLNARLFELRSKHEAIKQEYIDLRYGLGEKVARGGDPESAANELYSLQQQLEKLQRALEATNQGIQFLAKLQQR